MTTSNAPAPQETQWTDGPSICPDRARPRAQKAVKARQTRTCERVVGPVQLPGLRQTLVLAAGLHRSSWARGTGSLCASRRGGSSARQPLVASRFREESARRWRTRMACGLWSQSPGNPDADVDGEKSGSLGGGQNVALARILIECVSPARPGPARLAIESSQTYKGKKSFFRRSRSCRSTELQFHPISDQTHKYTSKLISNSDFKLNWSGDACCLWTLGWAHFASWRGSTWCPPCVDDGRLCGSPGSLPDSNTAETLDHFWDDGGTLISKEVQISTVVLHTDRRRSGHEFLGLFLVLFGLKIYLKVQLF